MAGDPFWDKVVFRSTLDAMPPVDVSPQALPMVASSSGPALTAGVFGNAMSYAAGNGAYRATSSGEAGKFGSGDFTVEGWFKQLSRSASGTAIFGMWPGGSRSWAIMIQEDTLSTSSQIRLFASSDGTAFDIINAQSGVFTGIALDQWYHFCLERSGNIARFYIDGVMQWKQTISGSLFDASAMPLRIFDGGQSSFFNNTRLAVDDLRITKGVARYGRDTGFALPTEAYPVESAPIGPASMLVTQGPGFGTSGLGLQRARPWGFAPASTLGFSTVPQGVEGIIPADGVLSRFRLSISGNTQSVATTTVTVRVNDQPTALSIAIPPATSGEFEVVADVPVVAGDVVYIGYQNSSTNASPIPQIRMTQLDYASFDGKVRIIHGISSRMSSAVNVSEPGLRFSPISTYYDSTVAWKSSLDDQALSPMGASGNIISATGFVRSNSLNAAAVFTLYKNGNPTALTLTVAAGVTGKFTATGGPVSVIPGDNLSWGRTITGLTSGSFWLTTLDTVFEAADGSYDLFTGPNLATTSPNWTAVAPGTSGFSGFGGLLDISTDDLASLRLPADGSVSRLRARGYTVGAPEEMPGFLTAEGVQQPLSVSLPAGSDMPTAPWVLSTDAPVSLLAGRKINFASVPPAGGVLENRRAAFAIGVTINAAEGPPPSPSVAPIPGSLTVVGEVPSVVAGVEVAPWSGSLSILGVVPQLVQFSGVKPQPGALLVSGAVPDLAFDLDLDALPGGLTLTGRAPGIFIGVTVAPGSGGLTVSGGTPGVFTISGAVSSQAAMLGLVQPPAPPSSASQLAAMALAEPPPPPTRASQAALMAIGEIVPVVAASQAAILALGQGSSCISYRCQLWTIRRRDGVVFRYTSHDQPVHRGPFVYSPCRSLDPTASENSSTLGSVGNIELTGIIDDDGISEADLYGGLFDDAYVTVDLYSWGDQAEAPRRLAAGWTGQVSQGDTSFQMEVLGPAARLDQQALVQMVTPGCRWIFGDSRCGVDVESMRLSGTVVAARTRGHLFVDVPAPPPGRQWANGRIRFTSGRNAGQIVETKSVDFGAGEVVTWVSPGFLAEPGDAIELLPGCDLSRDGGCTLYQNVINFGGFPDVPGSDALLESPDAKY